MVFGVGGASYWGGGGRGTTHTNGAKPGQAFGTGGGGGAEGSGAGGAGNKGIVTVEEYK